MRKVLFALYCTGHELAKVALAEGSNVPVFSDYSDDTIKLALIEFQNAIPEC